MIDKNKVININIRIGHWIRSYRIENDLTQVELAEKMNLSPQQLQKYERGTSKITVSMLEQISKLLNVTLYDMLDMGRHFSDSDTKRRASRREAQKISDSGVNSLKEDEIILLSQYRMVKSQEVKDSILNIVKHTCK